MTRATSEIERVVENLDYNFNEFELNHFLRHVESVRRREILLIPFPFDATVYGLWIPVESADYIFFNSQSHPVHQIHIVLHEVGHMVLKHQLRPIAEVLPPDLVAALQLMGLPGQLRMASGRKIRTTAEEAECEAFVECIQRKIVEKNRLHELIGTSSSIPALRAYTNAMSGIDGKE